MFVLFIVFCWLVSTQSNYLVPCRGTFSIIYVHVQPACLLCSFCLLLRSGGINSTAVTSAAPGPPGFIQGGGTGGVVVLVGGSGGRGCGAGSADEGTEQTESLCCKKREKSTWKLIL